LSFVPLPLLAASAVQRVELALLRCLRTTIFEKCLEFDVIVHLMLSTLLHSWKHLSISRSRAGRLPGSQCISFTKAEYPGHVPVLLDQVLHILNPAMGERVLDCTAGLGGHAAAIAQRLGPHGSMTLVDADASNLQVAADRVRSATVVGGPLLNVFHMNFRDISSVAAAGSADIVIADLGLCSSHIDNLNRGFSFRTHLKSASAQHLADVDAPLDMRFDQSSTSSSIPVSDWLRRAKAFDVAKTLVAYGELRPSAARRIAAAIEASLPVTTTKQLRDIVVQETGEVQPPLAQVVV
jgi:16S rRNA (cytosine1402-N4)-methyltransferase